MGERGVKSLGDWVSARWQCLNSHDSGGPVLCTRTVLSGGEPVASALRDDDLRPASSDYKPSNSRNLTLLQPMLDQMTGSIEPLSASTTSPSAGMVIRTVCKSGVWGKWVLILC